MVTLILGIGLFALAAFLVATWSSRTYKLRASGEAHSKEVAAHDR